MSTVNTVRDRILQLCEERNISINHLATISALPPSSEEYSVWKKSKSEAVDHQADL